MGYDFNAKIATPHQLCRYKVFEKYFSEWGIYGIELLNANEQLKRDKEGRLLVVNEAKGETMDIPFAV
jgi:hypothetical protein